MFRRDQFFPGAAVSSSKTALACLALLFVFAARAQADTLVVVGSSGSLNPPPGIVTFVSQSFNHNFTVTSAGQTFDFVFGRYSIPSGGGFGLAGCTDGPCLTLTGALTNPAGLLSFDGDYVATAAGASTQLSVTWVSGSGPFAFTTAEGGAGQFTIQLVDFFAVNATGARQLYDQLARITVTQFTPDAPTPTPEPATALLLGAGLAAVGAVRGRQSRRQGRGPHRAG